MFPGLRQRFDAALDLIVEFSTLGEYRLAAPVAGVRASALVSPSEPGPRMGGAGGHAARAAEQQVAKGRGRDRAGRRVSGRRCVARPRPPRRAAWRPRGGTCPPPPPTPTAAFASARRPASSSARARARPRRPSSSAWPSSGPANAGRRFRRELLRQPLDRVAGACPRSSRRAPRSARTAAGPEAGRASRPACARHVSGAALAAPQVVRPVVELDRGEQPLLVRVVLREAARAHRVVVLAGLGPRSALTAYLKPSCTRAMKRRSERWPPVSPQASMVASRCCHVVAHGALGVALAGAAPGQALEQPRVGAHGRSRSFSGSKPGT